MNLQFIKDACGKHNFNNYKIILIHCDDTIRHERLQTTRNQPELINKDMDNWADFLHRQAVLMHVIILDSGLMSVNQMVNEILSMVRDYG